MKIVYKKENNEERKKEIYRKVRKKGFKKEKKT